MDHTGVAEEGLYYALCQLLKFVPGQGSVSSQGAVSTSSPIQFAPSYAGIGLVHVLDLDLSPVPQGVEHVHQLSFSDHPPSTGTGTPK